tara:strand:- start:196 stop:1026 length:831 start_codon:yes stop_codon:yes gene_type:complete
MEDKDIKKEILDNESNDNKLDSDSNTGSELASEAVDDLNVKKDSDSKVASENVENDSDSKETPGAELPFIIGTKVGMTQIFSSNGTVYPVSVIQAGPCTVTQIKTSKTDGYNSVQLGYGGKKESKTNKSLLGHFKKSGSDSKKHLKEFRYEKSSSIDLGTEVFIDQFNIGDMLNITGISKGKGFAGHMKRHNFSGGRASHGKNSVMRKAGSIGAGTSPGRVWKGTRMAGRMGTDKVTVKNLELIKVDSEKNLLFVSGSIPGPNKNIIYISRANYES